MNLFEPWSLRTLVADLAAGRTTAEQAEARARRRITATDGETRAWVELAGPNHPRVGSTGLLAGVPMGVKDIIDLEGIPTRCGSRLRQRQQPASKDAAIVSAWRATGAVPLGKTVTTEFAFFEPGPTRNPVDLAHTPGGSSSGSAAAVASGQVPLAIGTQTAGSVTRPASYCGIAALVMTRDRFSMEGVVGLAESLDAHGVYAATVDDLALAWSALSDDIDVATRPSPGTVPRFAWWTAEPLGVVSDDMASLLGGLCSDLADTGVDVVPFPHEDLIAEVTTAHSIVMAYEAARERAAELASAEQLSEPLADLLRTGERTTADAYAAVRAVVEEGAARIEDLLAEGVILIGPAAPGAAPPGLAKTGDPVLSRAWQALGLAAVTIPGARDAAGMPLGVQVIAASELDVLRAALWAEEAVGSPIVV